MFIFLQIDLSYEKVIHVLHLTYTVSPIVQASTNAAFVTPK